ncbi:S1 RNA-binding domain-containing protein [Streptomyces sp. NPDC088789]|uniref:S1 RNA-binding domain-containing protein n=1 Tax=Streptomyces sp. NPDC088789 TaxID=3365899 RepID=UPI003804FB37
MTDAPDPSPLEQLRARLAAFRPGTLVTGTVTATTDREVVVQLADDAPGKPTGRIPGHLLSWTPFGHPREVVAPGRRITAEVQGRNERTGEVVLSSKACEDEALYRHLLGARPGDVVTGTVAAVHAFGVFVRLDGAPPHPVHPGTGFIRVPDLSWGPLDHPEDAVRPANASPARWSSPTPTRARWSSPSRRSSRTRGTRWSPGSARW